VIEKNFKDVSVIFETRSLKKDYPTGPFFEKNHNEEFKKAKSNHLFDFKASPIILDEVLK